MKKLVITFSIFIFLCITLCACDNKEIQIQENQSQKDATEILLTINQKSTAQNQIWVGTFQLVWNDMLNTINKGNPAILLPDMPECANELNKRQFSANYISEDSYYIKHGVLDKALLNLMKKEIKKKFNESSDILDKIEATSNFILYSMLKKDFKFKYTFDKLPEEPFDLNSKKIKYFGINNESNNNLRQNVKIINYKNENNFIVKLLTKSNDEVILYRTDEDKTLDKYWQDVQSYTEFQSMGEKDKLKIPCLDFFYKVGFNEIINKTIKGTNFIIKEAIETVDLKMDEKGVKLKSEAAIMLQNSVINKQEIHNYYFNKPFVMFLVEKGKTVPYFAAKIKDVDKINQRTK